MAEQAKEKRLPPFFWADNNVIARLPGIGAYGFAVYMLLAFRANQERTCWPSIAGMAEELGISANTVRRALKKLQTAKLIAIETAEGLNNTYTLLPITTPTPGEPLHHREETPSPQRGVPLPQVNTNKNQENKNQEQEIAGSKEPAPAEPFQGKPKTKTKAKNVQPPAVIKDYIAEMLFGTRVPLKDKWSIIVKLWNDLEMPTLDRLRTFEQWWYREDFRGKQYARPAHGQVKAEWEKAFSTNGNGNSALPDWWPHDHYGRPTTYDPPLTAQEYAWCEQYHATILKDLWHRREKWPQLVAAHLQETK